MSADDFWGDPPEGWETETYMPGKTGMTRTLPKCNADQTVRPVRDGGDSPIELALYFPYDPADDLEPRVVEIFFDRREPFAAADEWRRIAENLEGSDWERVRAITRARPNAAGFK